MCYIKDEAPFLVEWINYHVLIGIEHFYLYNNNSSDAYRVILQPYIDKGIVDLIEWPFEHSQMAAYEDCFKKYNLDTQWIAYIDLDEFICPKYSLNIADWLSPYLKYPGVLIFWKQFGTGGKLKP